jgi:hypothetical protein
VVGRAGDKVAAPITRRQFANQKPLDTRLLELARVLAQ